MGTSGAQIQFCCGATQARGRQRCFVLTLQHWTGRLRLQESVLLQRLRSVLATLDMALPEFKLEEQISILTLVEVKRSVCQIGS